MVFNKSSRKYPGTNDLFLEIYAASLNGKSHFGVQTFNVPGRKENMRLSPTGLRMLKAAHLLGAACWLGGAVSILTVNVISAHAESPAMLHGLIGASHAIDVWIVVNCGVYVCLLTGLVYGLCTPFGFFKFRWLQIKWLITCFCFLSGWFLLGNWEVEMLALSKTMPVTQDDHAYTLIRLRHFYLSLLQIALLITVFIVSVYKPGKRKMAGN